MVLFITHNSHQKHGIYRQVAATCYLLPAPQTLCFMLHRPLHRPLYRPLHLLLILLTATESTEVHIFYYLLLVGISISPTKW